MDIDQNWVGEEDEEDHEDDGPLESTPLLPIFSASYLGRCLNCEVWSRIS
jgi:hypothetical protein